jgi:hypothetical protein
MGFSHSRIRLCHIEIGILAWVGNRTACRIINCGSTNKKIEKAKKWSRMGRLLLKKSIQNPEKGRLD